MVRDSARSLRQVPMSHGAAALFLSMLLCEFSRAAGPGIRCNATASISGSVKVKRCKLSTSALDRDHLDPLFLPLRIVLLAHLAATSFSMRRPHDDG